MQKKLISIIFTFIYYSLSAQYYDSGQDPFSVKWQQIKTPTHTIIFEKVLETNAKIYAAYLKKISETGGNSLSTKALKVPVVMHNHSVISNGEVAWTPRRMNVYAVAPQNNGCQMWEQHLLTHEFRHTAQISKLSKGFTKGLYYVFGKQAIMAVLGLHVPRWFLEGDAVAFETASGFAGRGRDPNFSMRIKAQILDKKIYSYPKAQFGSYKNFVPNHYELGYQLIANNRQKFGTKIWDYAIDRVAKYPISINPFSRGIKKITKLPERKLYKQTLQDLQKQYADTENKNYINHYKQISSIVKNDYVNHYNPVFYKNGVLSIKTSYKRLPKLVFSNNAGKEQIIKTLGSLDAKRFSLAQNKIVWNEYKSGRWGYQDYNNIVLFDINTKKLKRLTKKGRVFSSTLSAAANKIVSAEVNTNIDWSLTIRNANNGELLQSFPFDSLQPLQPSWVDTNIVVFSAVSNSGKSLGLLDINTSKVQWILQNEHFNFSDVKCFGLYLVVKGIYNNTSNFFIYNLKNKTWKLATNVKYGVGEASLKNDTLVFSNYTANGFSLQMTNITESKKSNKPELVKSTLIDSLVAQEEQINFANLDTNFTVEKYSRLKNLIRFHSWAPISINTNSNTVGLVGVSAMSQNVTSTSFLNIGAENNQQQNYNKFFVNYSYKGFFPILHLNYNFIPYTVEKYEGETQSYINQLSTGVELPFKTNFSTYNIGFNPFVTYDFDALNFADNKYESKISHTLSYGFSMYNALMMSHRDIYPKFGQYFLLKYKHIPNNDTAQLFLAKGNLYFPSVFPNHSLYFKGIYQQKQDGIFNFLGNTEVARGHKLYENDKMFLLSVNYSMPILYPDLNIWEWVYIKRIWTNMFCDYSKQFYKDYHFVGKSVGAELYFDLHLFRFLAPIQMGVQYARKLDEQKNYFKFLFSFQLSGI